MRVNKKAITVSTIITLAIGLILLGILLYINYFVNEDIGNQNSKLQQSYDYFTGEDSTVTEKPETNIELRRIDIAKALNIDTREIESYEKKSERTVYDTKVSNPDELRKIPNEDLQKKLDELLQEDKSIDAMYTTTIKVFKVNLESGATRDVVKYERVVELDAKEGHTYKVIEYLDKDIVKSSSRIGGNFYTILDDPLIAFDMPVEEDTRELKVEYIVPKEADEEDIPTGFVIESDYVNQRDNNPLWPLMVLVLASVIVGILVWEAKRK